MSRKRIMVIGPTQCGKTTLVNELNGYKGPLRRTQDTIYGKYTIDVPSSYIEVPWMYKHLIATAQNAASMIVVMIDCSNPTEIYSPGFAKVFTCPVIGVIAKCDLKPENIELCEKQLKRIGVFEPYYKISVHRKTGMDELKACLFENKK